MVSPGFRCIIEGNNEEVQVIQKEDAGSQECAI